MKNQKQLGLSLVWILIGTFILGVLFVSLTSLIRTEMRAAAHRDIQQDIAHLRKYFRHQIACNLSLFADGSHLSPACQTAGQLLELKSVKGETLISAQDPPTYFGQHYPLRATCTGTEIRIEFARTTGRVSAFNAVNSTNISRDPLLNFSYGWTDLFPGISTPCHDLDITDESTASCVAAACAKAGANCNTFLEYQTVGGTSMNRGLGGVIYGCRNVQASCVESACSKGGANCNTFLEYQTVGGTSMNRGLGGVLYSCVNVRASCVEASCNKAGANCSTFLEYQTVGGTSMNRGLAGVLNFCQNVDKF